MSVSVERVRELLAERYAVERELGRGGMATVYLARDLVLDREVAVKVLLPDLGMALGAERFRREIEIESRLDHPHILGILGSGEAGGLLYYVMPFVAGESLRARMDREGQLPVEDAVRIAAEAAEALDYAHRQGVLHRDVKPENILLEDGKTLVADFGIARALDDEAGQRLTQTGVTLGTPVYMSPEQSFAERDLDGRSDLYSLGCVLYEMLAGTPPFTGPNAQAITARHHLEAVPSITVIRPSVSDEVEDLVYKALAKSRADRCTTGQFAESLRTSLSAGRTTERRTVATRRMDADRLGGRRAEDPKTPWQRWRVPLLAAALPLLAAAGAAWRFGSGSAEAAGTFDGAGSVAVLYFDDRSAGGQLGHVADGLTEELIADLEQIQGLQVASRDRVAPLRGAALPFDSIAARLEGTKIFVSGSVAEDGPGRVALQVTLVDDKGAEQDPHRFSLPVDSSLALRDSLVRYVREELGQQLSDRRARYATGSTEAWLLLKRAENASRRAEGRWRAGDSAGTRALLAEADSFAVVAAARDARWPAPQLLRGRLARRHAAMTNRPDAARPWLDSALGYAERAVRMAPSSAEALELRGTVLFDRVQAGLAPDTADARRLVDAADRDLHAATALPDASASAWVRLSQVSYRKLNTLEANRAAQKAYEKDAYLTSAADVLWRLFATSYDLAQTEDAKKWCGIGEARFPADARFVRCQLLLMTMPLETPDIPAAWRLVQRLDSLTPAPERPFRGAFDRILLAAALGRAEQPDSARRVLASLRMDASVDPRGELRGLEAFARTVAGDRDTALTLLERYLQSYPEHREGFRKLNTWWWQDIKGDPRYAALVRGG